MMTESLEKQVEDAFVALQIDNALSIDIILGCPCIDALSSEPREWRDVEGTGHGTLTCALPLAASFQETWDACIARHCRPVSHNILIFGQPRRPDDNLIKMDWLLLNCAARLENGVIHVHDWPTQLQLAERMMSAMDLVERVRCYNFILPKLDAMGVNYHFNRKEWGFILDKEFEQIPFSAVADGTTSQELVQHEWVMTDREKK